MRPPSKSRFVSITVWQRKFHSQDSHTAITVFRYSGGERNPHRQQRPYLLGIKVHRQKSKWRESRAWPRNRSTSSFSGGLRIAETPLAARFLQLEEFFSIFETQVRMMQSDANRSQPSNSLIIRENTGNYRDLEHLEGELQPKMSCLPSAFCRDSLLN